MQQLYKYDIPWDLIASALEDDLSIEEKKSFQQWLSISISNQEIYRELQQMWNNGLSEYAIYQSANENMGWDALSRRLENITLKHKNPGISDQPLKGPYSLRLWISIAAIFLAIFSIFILNKMQTSSTVYRTALNEQKKISLPDGTIIILKSLTELSLNKDYNKMTRTVQLKKGEAFFKVQHQQIPFVVEMGLTKVRDLGTSFTIKKGNDSINVAVSSGKVAFISDQVQQTKEISAGMNLSSSVKDGHFGQISSIISSNSGNQNLLHFNNTGMLEVAEILRKTYHRNIELKGSNISEKRLSANLEGLSFESSLLIICSSLNLEHSEKNGVYVLTGKE